MGAPCELAFTDCLAHERPEAEDTAVAVLRFANGALGVVEATTSAYPGYPKQLEVPGDRGGAVLADNKVVSWQGRDISSREEAQALGLSAGQEAGGGYSDPMTISHLGHERQLSSIARAVIDGREPAISSAEARQAAAIAEALSRSAALGRPISPTRRGHRRVCPFAGHGTGWVPTHGT